MRPPVSSIALRMIERPADGLYSAVIPNFLPCHSWPCP